MAERKHVLLRLDPAVHDAVQRWASDELRSVNAQIEVLLRQQLQQAGRLPGRCSPSPSGSASQGNGSSRPSWKSRNLSTLITWT